QGYGGSKGAQCFSLPLHAAPSEDQLSQRKDGGGEVRVALDGDEVLICRAAKVSLARHQAEIEVIRRRRRAKCLFREASAERRVRPGGRLTLGRGATVAGALDVWQTAQPQRQDAASKQPHGRGIVGAIEVVLEPSEARGVRDRTDRIAEALKRRHGRARLGFGSTDRQRDREQHKGGDVSGEAY
ncbi:MAG: hypothetical protein ACREOE_01175, partial [Gemmatimonadales bacterium]